MREPEDHIKAASAWSLGQIGRHSPDHAKALAVHNVIGRLLAVGAMCGHVGDCVCACQDAEQTAETVLVVVVACQILLPPQARRRKFLLICKNGNLPTRLHGLY